jgi:hypothetical protein
MKWGSFVNRVYSELEAGSSLFNFAQPFENEQKLTRELVYGLRKLFAESFSVKSKLLPYHVIGRQGGTQEEKLAWKQSKPEKWILFHGVRFVPDILVRLNDPNTILPIEVKLIKRAGSAQGIATAIGQSLIYAAKYPQTEPIIFIGINRSIEWGKYQLTSLRQPDDEKFYKALKNISVRMILRVVGV